MRLGRKRLHSQRHMPSFLSTSHLENWYCLIIITPFNLEKMKKFLLTFTTVVLFSTATLVSFSTSNGHLNFFKKASAVADNNYIVYGLVCSSGPFHIIIVCGEGGNGCIPSGTCPAS